MHRSAHCVFLLATAATVWGQPNRQGAWTPLANWPLIPLHTILTVDGRLLTYGTSASGQQTGKFIYDVWNPKAGGIALGHTTLPNNTNTDLFCSGQINLIDGRILISGGDNFVNGATNNTPNSDINIFTPSDNSLVRAGSLNRARWTARSSRFLAATSICRAATAARIARNCGTPAVSRS